MLRVLVQSLVLVGLLASTLSTSATPAETLLTATTEGKQLQVKRSGGNCELVKKGVRRRIGLNVTGPTTGDYGTINVVPAFSVQESASSGGVKVESSRLVVVDLTCKVSTVFATYKTAPHESWYPRLSEAVKLGYMDVREEDGKWGSWNLRTNHWDPTPCCSMPAHSLIGASWQRWHDRENAATSPTWPHVWSIVRPVVWVYAAVAFVCVLIAIGIGHRGAAIVGHGLVVMPLKAVWLAIVLVVAANVYALAGMLRSGALGTVAGRTIYSATRAWRR